MAVYFYFCCIFPYFLHTREVELTTHKVLWHTGCCSKWHNSWKIKKDRIWGLLGYDFLTPFTRSGLLVWVAQDRRFWNAGSKPGGSRVCPFQKSSVFCNQLFHFKHVQDFYKNHFHTSLQECHRNKPKMQRLLVFACFSFIFVPCAPFFPAPPRGRLRLPNF